jgi:hypothetical protein
MAASCMRRAGSGGTGTGRHSSGAGSPAAATNWSKPHGQVTGVIARLARLAAEHPPEPGSEHARTIARTLSYLENKQPFMDYPAALANGWPIATGVIEGACRHLVQDRMGITGADKRHTASARYRRG